MYKLRRNIQSKEDRGRARGAFCCDARQFEEGPPSKTRKSVVLFVFTAVANNSFEEVDAHG